MIVDGDDGAMREIRTCITGAHWFAGKKVRTVEGHATRDASGTITALSPVQRAFIEHFSFQSRLLYARIRHRRDRADG